MKKILIATSNPGKHQELVSALMPLEGIKFLSLDDLGIRITVNEHGLSYGENALIKAKAYFERSGIATISEDSGLEVRAISDELGIHTRRWGAGFDASDKEWLEYFMNRMSSEEDRMARFISHVVYIDETGQHGFKGECRGEITRDIEGPVEEGIPLSAVFRPLGHSMVYSAMSEDEKNSLSHRGNAARQLRGFLQQL